MKNFKHPDPHFNEVISDIYEDHLIKCKYAQAPEELEIMELKCKSVCSSIQFKDWTQELLFKDAFMKGYLSAFVISDEEQKILDSLTALGKAMAEK